eukprot:gene4025-2879_t
MLQRQKLWVPVLQHNPMFENGVERFLHNNPMSTRIASTLRLRPDKMFVALEPDSRDPLKRVPRLLAIPFEVTRSACAEAMGSGRRPISSGFATNTSDSLNSLHVMERLLPHMPIHVSVCLQVQQHQRLYEGDRVVIVSCIDKIGKRIAYCRTDYYVDQDTAPKEVEKAEQQITTIDDLLEVLKGYPAAITGCHVKNILEKAKKMDPPTATAMEVRFSDLSPRHTKKNKCRCSCFRLFDCLLVLPACALIYSLACDIQLWFGNKTQVSQGHILYIYKNILLLTALPFCFCFIFYFLMLVSSEIVREMKSWETVGPANSYFTENVRVPMCCPSIDTMQFVTNAAKTANNKSRESMAKGRGKVGQKEERQAPKERSKTVATAADTLDETLKSIDAVVAEASVFLQEQSRPDAKRRRVDDTSSANEALTPETAKAELFSAMLSLHLESMCQGVSALGLQLLPALPELTRRLLTLVSTPLVSCAEAWEACAMVALYYGVGTVNMVREIVEFVLREPGVLLLDCPCVVHPELMELLVIRPTSSGADKSSFLASAMNMEAVMERTERKLRSLRLMLAAAGEALDPAILRQFGVRFCHEIIQEGILPVGSGVTDDVKMALSAFQSSAVQVQWRVPSEWKPECILLLDTLLGLLRPAEPEMLRCSTSLLFETFLVAQRGMVRLPTYLLRDYNERPGEVLPDGYVGAAALAAATQLRRTLQLMQHPTVLPLKGSQESIAVERRQRRVFVSCNDGAPAETTGPSMSTPAMAAPEPVPVNVATPSQGPARFTYGASVSATATPPGEAPRPAAVKQAASAPPPPATSALPAVTQDEEELPDIDLDDIAGTLIHFNSFSRLPPENKPSATTRFGTYCPLDPCGGPLRVVRVRCDNNNNKAFPLFPEETQAQTNHGSSIPPQPRALQVVHHPFAGVVIAAVVHDGPGVRRSGTESAFFTPLRVIRVWAPGHRATCLTMLRSATGEDLFLLVQCEHIDADGGSGVQHLTYLYKRIEDDTSGEVIYQRLPRAVETGNYWWSAATGLHGWEKVDSVGTSAPPSDWRPSALHLLTRTGTQVSLNITVEVDALAQMPITNMCHMPGCSLRFLCTAHNSLMEIDLEKVGAGASAGNANVMSSNAVITRAWRCATEVSLTCATVKDHLIVCGTSFGSLMLWDLRDSGAAATCETGHSAPISGVHATDAGTIVSASIDGTLLCWLDVGEGNAPLWKPHVLQESAGEGMLDLSGDGNLFAAIGEYGTLKFFLRSFLHSCSSSNNNRTLSFLQKYRNLLASTKCMKHPYDLDELRQYRALTYYALSLSLDLSVTLVLFVQLTNYSLTICSDFFFCLSLIITTIIIIIIIPSVFFLVTWLVVIFIRTSVNYFIQILDIDILFISIYFYIFIYSTILGYYPRVILILLLLFFPPHRDLLRIYISRLNLNFSDLYFTFFWGKHFYFVLFFVCVWQNKNYDNIQTYFSLQKRVSSVRFLFPRSLVTHSFGDTRFFIFDMSLIPLSAPYDSGSTLEPAAQHSSNAAPSRIWSKGSGCEEEEEQQQPTDPQAVQFPSAVQELLEGHPSIYADPVAAALLRHTEAQLPRMLSTAPPQAPPLALTWHGSEGVHAFNSAGKRYRDPQVDADFPASAVAEMDDDSFHGGAAYYQAAGESAVKRQRLEKLPVPQVAPFPDDAEVFTFGRKRLREPPILELVSMGRSALHGARNRYCRCDDSSLFLEFPPSLLSRRHATLQPQPLRSLFQQKLCSATPVARMQRVIRTRRALSLLHSYFWRETYGTTAVLFHTHTLSLTLSISCFASRVFLFVMCIDDTLGVNSAFFVFGCCAFLNFVLLIVLIVSMDQQFKTLPVTQEQSELISQLQHSVLQTREHAIHIADSLEDHNTMLDGLHREVVETGEESRAQNHNLTTLLQESTSWYFYVTVVVLLSLILLSWSLRNAVINSSLFPSCGSIPYKRRLGWGAFMTMDRFVYNELIHISVPSSYLLLSYRFLLRCYSLIPNG